MPGMFPNDLSQKLVQYGQGLADIIHTEKREAFLDKFVSLDHFEECYALTDLKKNEIFWHHGIQKWTGLETAQGILPGNHITGHVHPFFRAWFEALVQATILVLSRLDLKTKALTPRFVISAPFDLPCGTCLVKTMGMPYEYDESKMLASVLYSYTIVGSFREEPVALKIYDATPNASEDIMQQIQAELLTYLQSVNTLSEMQIRVLQVIRKMHAAGFKLTNSKIAFSLRGKRGQPVTAANVKTKLNGLKERLLALMGPTANRPAFLKNAPALQVIKFFEDSSIISLLEADYRQRHP